MNLFRIPEERRLGLLMGASQLLGIAIARHVLGVAHLRTVSLEELVRLLTSAINRNLGRTD